MAETVIHDRYRVVRMLGRGGRGMVCLVEDQLRDNQPLALKTISGGNVRPEDVALFKQEFTAMTRLRHPNLVRVYDFGWDDRNQIYFLTMEYLEGKNLQDWRDSEPAVSEGKIVDCIVDMLRALDFIHSRRILHRDIKPRNVMIVQDRIKILDLGLADFGKEGSGLVIGTPQYMAPEVIRETAGPFTDVFSLGITFYELLAQRKFYEDMKETLPTGVPQTARTVEAIVRLLSDEGEFEEHQERALRHVETPALRAVIAKMTAYDPAERFQTCADVIVALNEKFKPSFSLVTDRTCEAYVLGAGFVGREQELDKLDEWLRAPENPRKLLLVAGKVGIGKSCLFREFRYRCQLRQIEFLETSCFPQVQTPYGAFLPLLREAMIHAPATVVARFGRELKKVVPGCDRLESVPAGFAHDPATERKILIDTIAGFFLAYAGTRSSKTVLCFNDLHWSDEAGIEVIEALLDALAADPRADHPLRLFASAREEEVENIAAALDVMRSRGQVETIRLLSFDACLIEKYIEAVFGTDVIDASLKEAIPEIEKRVGGNPFFLRELIKSLVDLRAISRPGTRWVLARPLRRVALPGDLKSLIRARLEKEVKHETERRLLETLALIPRAVTYDECKALAGGKESAVLRGLVLRLEELEILKLEEEESRLSLQPAHELIRETVVSDIAETGPLHLRIAECLESLHAASLEDHYEELAYHYSYTADRSKALAYLEKAADKAKAIFSNRQALEYYDDLLDGLRGSEPQREFDVLLKKGAILRLMGEWAEVEPVYKSALALAERLEDRKRIADAHSVLGWLQYLKADYPEAMAQYRQALTLYETAGEPRGIATTVGSMGIVHTHRGAYDAASACYEKALRICRETGDTQNYSMFIGNMGNLHRVKGEYDQALACYEEDLKISEQACNKAGISIAAGNIGSVYKETNDLEKALAWYDRAIAIGRELQMKFYLADYCVNRAEILLSLDRVEEARVSHQEGISAAESVRRKEYVFKARVLEAGIEYASALGAQREVLARLEVLLAQSADPEEQADLHYAAWQMPVLGPAGTARREEHRRKALTLYRKLYEKTPKIEFRNRIEALSGSDAARGR
jgi:serine/threonine protein kinase/tetratricopeptide (TPR) repeat protein